MPTEVRAGQHRVVVGGAVRKPVSLTLEEIAAHIERFYDETVTARREAKTAEHAGSTR